MTPFPLSAIVGMEALVEALLVNAVAPDVGGVLVRGERGTAKSTAVRALAPLLPPISVADDQAFPFAPGEHGPGGPIAADAPWRNLIATGEPSALWRARHTSPMPPRPIKASST